MFVPENFKNKSLTDVRAFIDANGFALLISIVDGRPWASHIPLILDRNADNKDILTGHISKGNKQWKDFDKNSEVLAVFTGPNAYISSSWYDHENVPTWNYKSVHVYGKIKIIGGETLKKQLGKLVDKHESGMEKPVSVEKMSPGFVEKEMAGIVGFEIEISDIHAANKLSQNRDEKNHKRIIEKLEKQGDLNSLEIARLMKGGKQET